MLVEEENPPVGFVFFSFLDREEKEQKTRL